MFNNAILSHNFLHSKTGIEKVSPCFKCKYFFCFLLLYYGPVCFSSPPNSCRRGDWACHIIILWFTLISFCRPEFCGNLVWERWAWADETKPRENIRLWFEGRDGKMVARGRVWDEGVAAPLCHPTAVPPVKQIQFGGSGKNSKGSCFKFCRVFP